MFRPGFAAIGRVRSSCSPAQRAERGAVDHGPGQIQLPPAPQFGEQGRMQSLPHARPLRSTKRTPVNAARSGIGIRPAYRRLRGRRFGKSGSMRLHKSSSIKAFGMPDRLAVGQAKVPSPRSKYKRVVS